MRIGSLTGLAFQKYDRTNPRNLVNKIVPGYIESMTYDIISTSPTVQIDGTIVGTSASNLASQISLLRAMYRTRRLVWIDASDQYQGLCDFVRISKLTGPTIDSSKSPLVATFSLEAIPLLPWGTTLINPYSTDPGVVLRDLSGVGLENVLNPLSMNCLDEDSLVETPTGTKKIKEIQEGEQVKGVDGWRNVLAKRTDLKETYKLTMQTGEQIVCTPEHRFPTTNGLRTAQSLFENRESKPWMTVEKCWGPIAHEPEALLYGIIAAEGGFRHQDGVKFVAHGKQYVGRRHSFRLNINVKEKELKEFIEKTILSLYPGAHFQWANRPNLNGQPGNGLELRMWQKDILCDFESKYETFLSKSSYSQSEINGFLCGLFEGDGTVGANQILFWQSKEKIIQVARRLLTLSGIPFHEYREKFQRLANGYPSKHCTVFTIRSNDVPQFMTKVSFLSHDKRDKVRSKLAKIEKSGSRNVVDLSVDGDHLYFANGILTHNCNYVLSSSLQNNQGGNGENWFSWEFIVDNQNPFSGSESIISECENTTNFGSWASPTNLTISNDTVIFKQGTASVKVSGDTDATYGQLGPKYTFTSQNWSSYDFVVFWFRSDMAGNATGEIAADIVTDTSNDRWEGTIGTLNANQWYRIVLPLRAVTAGWTKYGSPSLSTITEVAVFYSGSKGVACNCWIDEIAVDVGRWVNLEFMVPDNISQTQGTTAIIVDTWNGSSYQSDISEDAFGDWTASGQSEYPYTLCGVQENNYVATGEPANQLFPPSSMGTTKSQNYAGYSSSGNAPTSLTYTSSYGSSNRVIFTIFLPPATSDTQSGNYPSNDLTGSQAVNKVRIKVTVYYSNEDTSYAGF